MPHFEPPQTSPPQAGARDPEAERIARLLELRVEAERAYEEIVGERSRRPGLNQLLNCAQASCAYSRSNEARQVKRLQLAGASKRELRITRRAYVVRRRIAAPIWEYLGEVTRGIRYSRDLAPIGALEVGDQDGLRAAAEAFARLSPEEKRQIWTGER